VLNRIKVCQWD